MALHIIYFLIFLSYGIWIVGLLSKNEYIGIASSLLMFPLAIYIFVNGMDIFLYDNLLVKMVAAITFIIAVMTSVQATGQLINGG